MADWCAKRWLVSSSRASADIFSRDPLRFCFFVLFSFLFLFLLFSFLSSFFYLVPFFWVPIGVERSRSGIYCYLEEYE